MDAFHLAREAGFTNINMDLIVGLPGDTYETFCDTIEKVIALDPENVTVHALALKRSSFITQSGEINKAHADAALADRMMAYAEKRLTERGLEPYYLYRQSRMAGNLENTAGQSRAPSVHIIFSRWMRPKRCWRVAQAA